jgi:HlyD family secretion protein
VSPARLPRPGVPAAALLALLALAGCDRAGPAAAPQQTGAPGEGPRAAPRPVRLIAATEEVADRRVSATGTLAAEDQVVLGTKVAGRLAELAVDLGSPVKKGQVIARQDPTDARLRVEQAEAALHQARVRLGLQATGTDERVDPEKTSLVRQAAAVLEEARLTRDRMQKLFQQELVARAQLDAADSALGVADARYQDALEEVRNRQGMLLQRRSELDSARQALADTAIAAPIEGAVSARPASVGEYLAAGAPIITIVRLHPLRLRLAVPERDAAGVRAGQPVVVTVEGVPGEHAGRVARISPAFTEQNRTLLVEAEVPNPAAILRPGAFAKGDIVIAGDVRVVTVPASAVVTFAGVEKVLVVDKQRAVEVRVQTGRARGDRVEIASGLAAGTKVIVPAGNLTGGQAVTVTP